MQEVKDIRENNWVINERLSMMQIEVLMWKMVAANLAKDYSYHLWRAIEAYDKRFPYILYLKEPNSHAQFCRTMSNEYSSSRMSFSYEEICSHLDKIIEEESVWKTNQ